MKRPGWQFEGRDVTCRSYSCNDIFKNIEKNYSKETLETAILSLCGTHTGRNVATSIRLQQTSFDRPAILVGLLD